MDGHDAAIDAAAIPQLDQRRVRLLLNQFLQPVQPLARDLGPPSAAVRLRGNRPPLPSPLQQSPNPCRADPVKPGDVLPGASLLIAGPHDPFPQIH